MGRGVSVGADTLLRLLLLLALLAVRVPAAAQAHPGASPQAWAAAAILSRGVAISGGPAGGTGRDEADAEARLVAAVADAGFRSVQLAWPDLAPGAPSEVALQRLDRLVDAFLARGLAVVLHDRDPAGEACVGGGVGQPGAAATGGRVDPAAPLRGNQAAPRRATVVALPRAGDVATWGAVARRYALRSARLMFMLSLASAGAADADQANRQLRRQLQAIRASNPRRPVVIAWGDAINLPRLQLPPDRHLLVAVVNREPERFTHQGAASRHGSQAWRGADCCNPREAYLMGLPLDLAQAWSARHRVPVWLNGFGAAAGAPAPARARHARLMRDAAEARALPWAYCAWNGKFGLQAGPAQDRRALHDALLGH